MNYKKIRVSYNCYKFSMNTVRGFFVFCIVGFYLVIISCFLCLFDGLLEKVCCYCIR